MRKYLVRIAATLAIAGSLVGLGDVGVAHAESYTLVLRGVTAVTCYNAGDAGVRAGFYRQYFCNQQGYNSYRLYVIYA